MQFAYVGLFDCLLACLFYLRNLFSYSEHFLKLEIYYGELNFEVIEEEYAYTVRTAWVKLLIFP